MRIAQTNLNIPVSVNKDSLGEALPVHIVNGMITHIVLISKNSMVNFLDVIKSKFIILKRGHLSKITSFDDNCKFYLVKDKFNYVLAVKILSNDYIEKNRYSLNGVVINHITDRATNNVIVRNYGDKQIIIENNKIISTMDKINNRAIKKPIYKESSIENNNIGVIDLETYKARDCSIKVYALGFYTNLCKQPTIYYIKEFSYDSSELVLRLVDEILRDSIVIVNYIFII